MKFTDRENDLFKALSGTAKSALSLLPVVGQAIAGMDAYKRSAFERSVLKLIEHLSEKVEDLDAFFRQEYFQSDEGEQILIKILDSALDAQLNDKQELFVNALVNAPVATNLAEIQKLKFVDMLRHLSLAALMVLSEMHKMFIAQVRGPGHRPDPTSSLPQVDPESIAMKLGHLYEPYLVTSAIYEMQSVGLFSKIGEWRKQGTGEYATGAGFATELCYTDFSARFVEFITITHKGQSNE